MGFTTALTLGLVAASTVTSVVAQKKAANAQAQAAEESGTKQREAAESQATLSDYNAAVAHIQERDAIERGKIDADRFRRGVKVLIGEQRAGFASANVDVGFGSAVDVQADAAFLGELDALTIETNASREAWGYAVQAEDQERRAEIQRKEGVMLEETGRTQAKAAKTGGTLSAIGTVLNAGSSLLMARYGFGRK